MGQTKSTPFGLHRHHNNNDRARIEGPGGTEATDGEPLFTKACMLSVP